MKRKRGMVGNIEKREREIQRCRDMETYGERSDPRLGPTGRPAPSGSSCLRWQL